MLAPTARSAVQPTLLMDDGVLHGPKSGGGSCGHTELVVDALDVVIGGLGGDDELFANLVGGEASCGET